MGQHSIGERFGDYKLVRLLGEGGFASVYLGQEVHDGTFAAVKLLKEQKIHDFINEVSRTNRLQHPNIVKILDFGIRTPDNTAFIIMEYAPHGSFREKFPKDTRVPLDVIVTSVKQVAAALQYAHDQRIIHRDVKPENLLFNAQNLILLSDFGIATASRTAMTAYAGQAGQTVITGTYAYTAPEQLKGHPVPASDQYSLAIMVYEWLCGTLPFEGREFMQWRYQHQEVPPPSLREHIPSLAPSVEQVVLKALAKKPEERFERVETFSLALERAAQGEDVSAIINLPGHSIPFDSTPTGKQGNVLAQTPANQTEQLFQEGVRAQASGDIEAAFRIWWHVMTTPKVAEKYSTPAHKRVQELRPQMLSLYLKRAREASLQGRWQEEIRLWEDLLALEPAAQEPALKPILLSKHDKTTNNTSQRIQVRLQIARQNEQFAWMYTGAQQFIHNRDNASARTQLQMLWQDVPYYGDPSALAQLLGLPAALNYEQAIAAEQVRLEQERVKQEREREKSKRDESRIIITIFLVGAIVGGVVGGIVGRILMITLVGIILGIIVGILAGLALGLVVGFLTFYYIL